MSSFLKSDFDLTISFEIYFYYDELSLLAYKTIGLSNIKISENEPQFLWIYYSYYFYFLINDYTADCALVFEVIWISLNSILLIIDNFFSFTYSYIDFCNSKISIF